MADDEIKQQREAEGQDAEGGGDAALKKESSKRLLIVGVGIVAYTGLMFGLMFTMGWGPGATASAIGEGGEELPEIDIGTFAREAPVILKLKEITIYPKSNKGRGPNRITCQIDIVISKEVYGKLNPEGEKSTLMELLTVNVRYFFRQLLEEYGVTLADPAAKGRFQREAKLRLNLLKVEGDQEMQRILRLLRGHVLQVIINELEQSNY